jgi:hypothetical protein
MVAEFNNELLSSLRLLKNSQDAISSKIDGALERISDNEEKGIIPTRGGSRDSVDGGLSYGVLFSIIDGINCSPKAVLACRSVNLVFVSFSVQ